MHFLRAAHSVLWFVMLTVHLLDWYILTSKFHVLGCCLIPWTVHCLLEYTQFTQKLRGCFDFPLEIKLHPASSNMHLLIALSSLPPIFAVPNITGTPISEELVEPGAEECISFTRLLGRIKKEFSTQQTTNITDLECQDRCISAASSCQAFSFGITDNGITECILTGYNRKTQPNLFNDNGMIQNFAFYEKSREGCMERKLTACAEPWHWT